MGHEDRADVVGIGIEGTVAPHCLRDTLEVTGHYERLEENLGLINTLGVREFRYPIPWHRIERVKGARVWDEMDRVMEFVEAQGLTLIADTLHHNPPPRFDNSFLNAELVEEYPDFVEEFALRYPQVETFVPFNEPTATLDFCACRKWWYPYLSCERSYVKMLRNSARAASEAIHRLRAIRPVFILHVDTAEHHAGLDPQSVERANFLNHRRFLFDELLMGRVDEYHPLYTYLVMQGFDRNELAWFVSNAVRLDARGVNYYKLNEEELEGGLTKNAPSLHPRGFASVAYDYYERLGLPLRMTETNIQGFIEDRVSWLKYMRSQYELLRTMLPKGALLGFDWYPLFDCKGWYSLLQADEWPWDPQGIFWCDVNGERRSSELSHWYSHLASGGSAADIPAYTFHNRLQRELQGFMPQMQWDWQKPVLDGEIVLPNPY